MEVIEKNEKLDRRVTSRYTVVLAAAKRARQLTDGANPLTYAPTDRAVSIAVKEMNEGKLRLKVQDNMLDGSYERMIKDQYRYRGMTAVSRDDLREDLKQDYAPTPYNMDDTDDGMFTPFVQEEPIAAVAKDEDDDFIYEDSEEEPTFSKEEPGGE
jgi:DNA-directed RNA polymerase omega subunit